MCGENAFIKSHLIAFSDTLRYAGIITICTKNMATKTITQPHHATLKIILREIQSLRREVQLLLPSENLKEYAHPKRIKHSLSKALKKYPMDPVWK